MLVNLLEDSSCSSFRSGKADPVQLKGRLKQSPFFIVGVLQAIFLLSGIDPFIREIASKIADLSLKSPSLKSLLNRTRNLFFTPKFRVAPVRFGYGSRLERFERFRFSVLTVPSGVT